MERLYKISLVAVLIAAFSVSCKKTLPYTPDHQNDYVLEATVSGEAKYDGSGDLSYTVKSIRKIDKKEEFVPWTMEFSTDNGAHWTTNKPDFLTLTTQENNGSTAGNNYNATFAPQVKTIGGTSAEILKAREIKNDLDLSYVDVLGNTMTQQSTANCYVIHNPGTYKFPTIYGNAMKNGADNKSAYNSSKQGQSYILSPFLGAHGPITKPQIEGIANACLIWQDTQNLISNISFDSSTQYVKFEVNKATIHNGNAIIAVRDNSNTILWSWHIWVTEEDLTPVEITNHGGYKYNILPVNLGWCGLNNDYYKQREVLVKIKQTKGNKVQEVILRQTKFKLSHRDGNCPYYQWGRKDPMLPGDGITAYNGKDKTCYPSSAEYKFKYGSEGLNTTDIKEYIRNPHKFNIKWEMDGKYFNLWSTDNERTEANDDVVIKSVYDPSPVGYSLPASNVFRGFTTTSISTVNPAEFNVKGNWDNGYYFYTKPNKQGKTVFFPASGYRYWETGSLNFVTTHVFYWVAGPNGRDDGRCLYFDSGRVSPLHSTGRSFGFSVRPAQEK